MNSAAVRGKLQEVLTRLRRARVPARESGARLAGVAEAIEEVEVMVQDELLRLK